MFEFLFNFHKWIDTIEYGVTYISVVMRRCVGGNFGRDYRGTYIFYVVKCTPQPNHDPAKQVASSSEVRSSGFFFWFCFLDVNNCFDPILFDIMQRVVYDDVSRSGSCDEEKEAKIIHSYIVT